MKAKERMIWLFCFVLLSVFAFGCGSENPVNPVNPANNSPAISSLTADPAIVATGGTSAIACSASDPDGDPLTYFWTADSGIITGSGSSVVWTAPATAGTYAITCKVSDGKLEASIQVRVGVEKTVPVNNPPAISSLTADPAIVATSGTSAITCSASDPDGDPLTYFWTADSGIITGSGSSVVWTAPATAGTYAITCKVSDGKLETSMQVRVGVEKAETVNTWKITGFNEIFTVLVSGENIILVGESNSAQKGLKVQKRSLADPDTIIWTYENNDGVICKASWYHANQKCIATVSPSNGGIYVSAVSETLFKIAAIDVCDLAWRILKININGELVWDKKSDQTYHDSQGEYPRRIAVSDSEEVYVLGDQGVIMPDRTRRLEKRNGSTGELIWSSTNSYIWPDGLAVDKDKSYIAGGNNFLVDPMDDYGIIEAVDNSNGSLLWRIEYNPIPEMYSYDNFDDIKVHNGSLCVVGRYWSNVDSGPWQINKRSVVDGSLLIKKITDNDRSSAPEIFVDGGGIYVFGGGIVEKYDHDLNLVWSKTFGTDSITAVAKNSDLLYLVVTDGYLMYGLKVISSSTGD